MQSAMDFWCCRQSLGIYIVCKSPLPCKDRGHSPARLLHLEVNSNENQSSNFPWYNDFLLAIAVRLCLQFSASLIITLLLSTRLYQKFADGLRTLSSSSTSRKTSLTTTTTLQLHHHFQTFFCSSNFAHLSPAIITVNALRHLHKNSHCFTARFLHIHQDHNRTPPTIITQRSSLQDVQLHRHHHFHHGCYHLLQ